CLHEPAHLLPSRRLLARALRRHRARSPGRPRAAARRDPRGNPSAPGRCGRPAALRRPARSVLVHPGGPWPGPAGPASSWVVRQVTLWIGEIRIHWPRLPTSRNAMDPAAPANHFESEIARYNQWREELTQSVHAYHDWLESNGQLDVQQSIRFYNLLENLNKGRLMLAFLAEFSRGESELINALFFA